MDKCWFVLRQTHYPPPTLPRNGMGLAKGAICPGHLIPDLKHLDKVINKQGLLEFGPDMPVYPTTAWNLSYEIKKTQGGEVGGKAGAPIAAAVGVTVNAEAKVAFEKSVKNHCEFDTLETFIIQPTREYIEDSLDDDAVTKYIDKIKFFEKWSIFMITGVAIARGAKIEGTETKKQDLRFGPGLDVPGIVEAAIDLGSNNDETISKTATKATDFVWAIRLAKISNGWLDREWDWETFSKGATFTIGDSADQKKHIGKVLAATEDVNKAEVIGLDNEEENDVFVVPAMETTEFDSIKQASNNSESLLALVQ